MSLQKGLVGHWTFDAGATSNGTAYDSSAGDLHGSVSVTNTGVSSPLGEGYEFDGTGDNVDVGNNSFVNRPAQTNEITISAWVNPQFSNMDGKGTVCTNNSAYYFQVESAGNLSCYTYNNNSGSSSYFDSASTLTENVWSHIVFTQDSSGTRRLYINATLDNSGNFTGEIDSTSNGIGIGSQIGSRRFDGKISDVRIYDRALSESEISALYNMRSQRQKNVKPYQLRPRAGSGPNLMDATSWSVGTDGSQGEFDRNGAVDENSIIEEDTPYGDLAPIWYGRSESTDDGSDGGWNWRTLSTSDIDRDKTYRYSVWMKQEYTSGSFYHGTENVEDSNGNFNSNPYYDSGNLPTMNDWYLLVGFNHPRNASKSLNESAIYDIDGNKVQDIQDFWWEDNDTDFGSQGMRWRSYYYYDTNVGRGVRFYDPRLEIMEDSRTPLSAMFNAARDFSDGRDRIWFDGFEAGNLEPTWSLTDGDISSTRQYEGSNSFGQWGGGNAVEATWKPFDGEKKISEFEYYWKEDSSQTGHVVILYDGNGNEVQESGTENPQWYLNDGSGGRFQEYGGDNYNVWTHFKFTFDWSAGNYNYRLEDLQSGTVRTGTTALDNATGVSEIRFTGAGYGTADYNRFDNITVRK